MANVYTLISVCQAAADALAVQTQQRLLLWNNWLQPLSADKPAGYDPGYDDDFQQMREEVNKITGADSDLICRLAEKLLTTVTKDIRVASYYAWARLHRDGESGLADGLELLAGLMQGLASSCTRCGSAAEGPHLTGSPDSGCLTACRCTPRPAVLMPCVSAAHYC